VHSSACQPGTGQSASLICYTSRSYHPYYYHLEDGTIVAYAPNNSLIVEDSPPSYEMALLCPSVAHHHYPPSTFINATPIQVILSQEQNKDKNLVENGRERIDLRQSPTSSPSQTPTDPYSDERPHEDASPAHEDNPSENSAPNTSDDTGVNRSPDNDQHEAVPTG